MNEILEMVAGAVFYILAMIVVTIVFLAFMFGVMIAPMPIPLLGIFAVFSIGYWFIKED